MQKIKTLARKASSTRKGRIILISLFILVLAAAGGSVYYWNINKKSIIKSELDKTLVKKTEGLYTISYHGFELNEAAGSLVVKDCSLVFDTTVLTSKQYFDDEPSMVFNLFIPQLTVSGVQTPRALLDKEIAGNSIDIFQPTIELIYTGKGKDSSRTVPREELYKQLLGKMQSLQFEQVSIRNAQVYVRKLASPDTLLSINNLTLVLTKLLIDSTSSGDSSRLLFAEGLAASVESVQWKNKNGLYQFQLDTISINSTSKNMTIKHFEMEPTLSEAAFMKARGVQTDRLDIRFENTQLLNLDIKSLFNQAVVADSLFVGEANIKVYKDMSLPRDNKNRVGTFPHQTIKTIPVDLTIKKGNISNAYIEYKQLTPQTNEKGRISFSQTSIAIDNITNTKAGIERNKICRVAASTRFQNNTPISALFRFDLSSKNGAFKVHASIGSIPASVLSNISEPLAATRIENGTINGVEIDVRGSDYTGQASVRMRYQDLKLAIMEKDKEDGSLNKKGFVSAAANLLVKNNNPGKDGKLRVGRGIFKRDTNRSFFNLIWKSIFVAFADTLGINAKTEAQK